MQCKQKQGPATDRNQYLINLGLIVSSVLCNILDANAATLQPTVIDMKERAKITQRNPA